MSRVFKHKEREKLKRIKMVPSYLDKFQCIGSACKDNCCVGWDVDIDKETYYKYKDLKDRELLDRTQKFIYRNKDSFSDFVDFGRVKLLSQKRCAFLNEKNLCMLQAKLGEKSLSNVCATYPRLINEVDGVREVSATVSCEEAARLILMNPDGFSLKKIPVEPDDREILTYEVDTKKPGQSMMIKFLPELRELSMKVLKHRDLSLEDRMLILKGFFLELEQAFNQKNDNRVLSIIKKYSESLIEVRSNLNLRSKLNNKTEVGNSKEEKITLIVEFLKMLDIFNEIDSKSYRKYTKDFLNGLGLDDNCLYNPRLICNKKPRFTNNLKEDLISEDSSREAYLKYTVAHTNYYEPFMEKYGYVLENYLENYMYGNLFPASESESPKEAFMMLAVRFFIIKTQLVGIASSNRKLSPEMVVSFIQSFSKAIEHHKTYLEDLIDLTKKKKSVGKDINVLIVG
jgi:lysine-N-methylase